MVWIAPACTPFRCPRGHRRRSPGLPLGDDLRSGSSRAHSAGRPMVTSPPPTDVAGPLVTLLPAGRAPSDRPETIALSSREREVLALDCGGLGNKAIAHRLCLSLRTVENYLASVFAELGVSSRIEAAVLAIRSCWMPEPDASPGGFA